jgi:hypothetical protein
MSASGRSQRNHGGQMRRIRLRLLQGNLQSALAHAEGAAAPDIESALCDLLLKLAKLIAKSEP